MPLHQKIFGLIAGLFIFVMILFLVKKGKLREEFSWLWLLMGFVMLVLVLWYDLLLLLTKWIGAVTPTSTLFIFGIISLMLIALHFAIKISTLSDQVKNLAQQLSLLETERET